jgi:thioredoxin 1
MNVEEYSGSILELSSKLTQLAKLTVIDIYSPTCGICRRLAQEIPKIASTFPNATFLKINTTENEEIAEELQISSLPTVKFFKVEDGEPVEVGESLGCKPDAIRKIIQEKI